MRTLRRLTIGVALSATAALPVSMARAVQGPTAHSAPGHAGSRHPAQAALGRATLSFTAPQPTGQTPTPPAPPGAAAQQGTLRPAPLELRASPASPRVGQRVRLTVVGAPDGASDYTWNLGAGAVELHGGPGGSKVDAGFRSTGVRSVAVRVQVGEVVRAGVLRLDVRPHAAPSDSSARASAHAAPSGSPARASAHAAPSASSARASAHSARAVSAGLTGRVTAHVAGDPGVTIADFQFSPATTTIHVGDTITWTNNGPSSHTATARNGSFDTGVLKKGQSASHTFTQPGTYTFFCQIHPFMHGTIVVLASTPTTTTTTNTTTSTPAQTQPAGSTATTTTSTTTSAAAAGTKPALPLTGWNVFEGLAAGLLLFGLGSAMRRLLAR